MAFKYSGRKAADTAGKQKGLKQEDRYVESMHE